MHPSFSPPFFIPMRFNQIHQFNAVTNDDFCLPGLKKVTVYPKLKLALCKINYRVNLLYESSRLGTYIGASAVEMKCSYRTNDSFMEKVRVQFDKSGG